MNSGLYGLPRGRRKKVTFDNFIGCRVFMTGTFTLPTTTEVMVPWDSEVYNFGVCHSTIVLPTRFTAPVDGWYDTTITYCAFSSGTTFQRYFYNINFGTPAGGSAVKILGRRDTSKAFTGVAHGSATCFLKKGEFIETGIWQDQGAKTFGGNQPIGTAGSLAATFARVG